MLLRALAGLAPGFPGEVLSGPTSEVGSAAIRGSVGRELVDHDTRYRLGKMNIQATSTEGQ